MNVYHTYTYSVQAVQGPTYVWATQQADFGGAVGIIKGYNHDKNLCIGYAAQKYW